MVLIDEPLATRQTDLYRSVSSPDRRDADAQLVGGDLGIDSIDVLELVLMLEKDYAVAIKDRELGAKVFASLRTLAAYVSEQSPGVRN